MKKVFLALFIFILAGTFYELLVDNYPISRIIFFSLILLYALITKNEKIKRIFLKIIPTTLKYVISIIVPIYIVKISGFFINKITESITLKYIIIIPVALIFYFINYHIFEELLYWNGIHVDDSAKVGNPISQYFLGLFYYYDREKSEEMKNNNRYLAFPTYTKRDYKKAFYWFDKSSMVKNKKYYDIQMKAEFIKAKMIYKGEGVLQDKSKAIKMIKLLIEDKKVNNDLKERAKKFWEDNELWKY